MPASAINTPSLLGNISFDQQKRKHNNQKRKGILLIKDFRLGLT